MYRPQVSEKEQKGRVLLLVLTLRQLMSSHIYAIALQHTRSLNIPLLCLL